MAAAGWGSLCAARQGAELSSSPDEGQSPVYQAGRTRLVATRVCWALEMLLCQQHEQGLRCTAGWQAQGPQEEDMQQPAPDDERKLLDWTHDSKRPLWAALGSDRRGGRGVDREPAANAEPDSARDTRRQWGQTLGNVYQLSRREETVKTIKQFVSVIVNLFAVRPLEMWKSLLVKPCHRLLNQRPRCSVYFRFRDPLLNLFKTRVYSGQIYESQLCDKTNFCPLLLLNPQMFVYFCWTPESVLQSRPDGSNNVILSCALRRNEQVVSRWTFICMNWWLEIASC